MNPLDSKRPHSGQRPDFSSAEFFQDGGKNFNANPSRSGLRSRWLGLLAIVVVVIIISAGAAWFITTKVTSATTDTPVADIPAQTEVIAPQGHGLDAEQNVPVNPTFDPGTGVIEAAGAMIVGDPNGPMGATTPSQTIQSFDHEFYGLRSAEGSHRYMTATSPYTVEILRKNIEAALPGTTYKQYIFPTEKRPVLPPGAEGTDPQIYLVTLLLTIPDGRVFVYSQEFTIAKVGQEFRIANYTTFGN